jgi:hypothetical protein
VLFIGTQLSNFYTSLTNCDLSVTKLEHGVSVNTRIEACRDSCVERYQAV